MFYDVFPTYHDYICYFLAPDQEKKVTLPYNADRTHFRETDNKVLHFNSEKPNFIIFCLINMLPHMTV